MPIDPGHLDRALGIDARTSIPPRCPNCGYDLRGAVSSRCPECGFISTRADARQQAVDAKQAMAEYREALSWGRRGMILGAVGLALAAVGLLLPGGWLKPIVRCLVFLAGPIAFFLGLSVCRTQTQHRLSSADGEEPTRHTVSYVAVGLGVADTLLAVAAPW